MDKFNINKIDRGNIKTLAIYHFLKIGDKVQWNGQLYFRNKNFLPYISTEGTVISRFDDEIIMDNVKIKLYIRNMVDSPSITLVKYNRKKEFILSCCDAESYGDYE